MSLELGYKKTEGGMCAAKGFKASAVHAGIKKGSEKPDMMLVCSDVECTAAAVYTKNKVKGAPITVTKKHLENGVAQAILCNSGNANTCAPNGEEFAIWSCELLAQNLGIKMEDVVVASTGVIGQALEKEPFERGVPMLCNSLSYDAGTDAAVAMMTTDTVKKEAAVSFVLGGKTCVLGAAAKGSGMICPDMATLLSFATTDVCITAEMLQKAVSETVKETLNQVNVDGDTSTNDTLAVLANGLAENPCIQSENDDYRVFCGALLSVLTELARMLAADGEGASKLLCCKVNTAQNANQARNIAKTVISSDLFKAAMFGEDANWGRVLCAIGYTPGDFSVDNIEVSLKSEYGEVTVCRHSAHHQYSEEEASRILSAKEIDIVIQMNSGTAEGVAWGCDLTYEYVKINGDYRS